MAADMPLDLVVVDGSFCFLRIRLLTPCAVDRGDAGAGCDDTNVSRSTAGSAPLSVG